MPDSSAGTKELYFAWIGRVAAISALAFHNHKEQMFHVEHQHETKLLNSGIRLSR